MTKSQPVCCTDCYVQLGWTFGYQYLPIILCDECHEKEKELENKE